ncbi:MAG: NUDIX hydrolase [Patescibacteria group bacterium]|jgi:ADP-ribose pyrophosphatase YjhB (NUDIX family)|nr:NUDIX hydrolase [Candidatus Shapirobacteria bacterium]
MSQIIIASGPVIVENNKVLLNKDEKDNFWKFCGGRVEESDFNLKDTAKREVKEEMGVEIEILDNNPYFFYTEKGREDKAVSIILVHFLAKRIGEIILGQEIKEWCWMDLKDLDGEDLAPNIKPTLKYFGFLE